MKRFLLLAATIFTSVAFSQSPESEDDSFQKKRQGIVDLLNSAEANGYSGTVLAAEKGKVIFKGGIGMADKESSRRQTEETVFSIGSITKQFTAAAIMKLEAQGKLKVEDPLSAYFPDAPSDKKNITLHIQEPTTWFIQSWKLNRTGRRSNCMVKQR